MRTMTKPPSPNIRLTITVTPEVHAAFSRMAEASSMSLGRCMGEWLADTVEGVEFVTAGTERSAQFRVFAEQVSMVTPEEGVAK